jgi:hypothetical protein
MRLFVVAFFLTAFLDALSTYVVVVSGRGVEANPAVAGTVNSNPAAVFPLALISAAPASTAVVAAERLAGRLSAALRARAVRFISAACVAAVLLRAVAVANNLILLMT